MLERLNEVAWENLEHAYGSAKDVPELLRKLASPDLEEFKRALHALYGNIYHQGDRYSASPHAIPFLFELAWSPGQKGRSNVLQLITSLLAGDCGIRNGQTLNDGERVLFFGREVAAEEFGDAARVWFECYQAALPYVDSLLDVVESGDDAIGLPANYVLSCFRPLAGKIAPRILARVRVEPYDDRKMAQLFALHRLHGPAFDAVSALSALSAELPGVAGTMAALCLANLTREQTSEAVCGLLAAGVRAINQDPKLEEFYAWLPFNEGFAGDLGHVIGRISHAQARRSLAPLGRILSGKVDIVASMGVASGTLRAGFAAPYRPGTPLADGERTALAALLTNEEVWRVTNNHYTFKSYGLPFRHDDIAKLIGIDPGDAARGEAAFDQAMPLAQEGRVSEALPLFEEAVRFRPQVLAAWLNVAWAMGKLERYAEAAAVATRGLAVFEESTQLSSELAGALIALKRYPECEAAAAHGLRYADNDGYLLYTRACANALMGNTRAALEGVRLTIEADPQARAEIARDPDFDSLKTLAEFQALIAAPNS